MTTLRLPHPLATLLLAIPLLAGPAGAAHAALQKAAPKKTHHAAAGTRALPAPAGPPYAGRPEIMAQAEALAAEAGLDAAWVRHAIGAARYQATVARAVLPPPAGVAKNWAVYRARFVEPKRVRAGVAFWRAQHAALERAEAETGVPAAIVVGILGVESLYGRDTGRFRVIDALCTLAFDFPPEHPRAQARAAFFRSELLEFLRLTAQTHTDPLALRGSYAGAMGWPQFMPSSWRRYAVDFDGDGHTDLFNSQPDMIGSVANYFRAFGWRAGMPTHYGAQLAEGATLPEALRADDITPRWTAAELAAAGVLLDPAGAQHAGPLALVELQNGENAAPTYVAGTENFYAITRYNWSSYYAMAVIALGQTVADAVAAAGGVPK